MSSKCGRCFRKKDAKILVLGLDKAGKSSILYRVKLREIVTCIPTNGFNIETIELKKLVLTLWDIWAEFDNLIGLLRHYYRHTDGVIYVIDSSDKERLSKSKELLDAILSSSDLKNVPFLVMANKQDIATLTENEIHEGLDLESIKDRPLHFQSTSVIKGTGIDEGLTWLADTICQSKT